MFRVHAPIGAFVIHALFELDMFIIELCNSHSVNSNQFQCINIEKKNATVDLCRFLYFFLESFTVGVIKIHRRTERGGRRSFAPPPYGNLTEKATYFFSTVAPPLLKLSLYAPEYNHNNNMNCLEK